MVPVLDSLFDEGERKISEPSDAGGSPCFLGLITRRERSPPREIRRTAARVAAHGSLAAVRSGRVVSIDAALLSRPGPRIVEGLAHLARLLHPEVSR